MRAAEFAGVLCAFLPGLALAQVKVELGDGVAVMFPSAPRQIQTATDRTPAPPSDAPPMPVDPRDPRVHAQHERTTDFWALRQGGATFTASATTPYMAHRPLPGPALHESRRVSEDGRLSIIRSFDRNGRSYMVTFDRAGPDLLKRYAALGPTPSEAEGEAFLNSLTIAGAPAN